MNIVIDLGNTSTKIGFFGKSLLKKNLKVDGLITIKNFQKLIAGVNVESVIISSVRGDSQKLERYIKTNFKTINLTPQKSLTGPQAIEETIKFPYKNLYKTPETLGRDRLANVAAAVSLFPLQHALIIDAGTCLKFDFVNKKGIYYGGSIAPGLRMRYKSLHEYTGKLPLIAYKKSSKMIGQTTEESIRTGVQRGMIHEVVETIAQYEKSYPGINIILTGGDWRLFVEHLKKTIFADPFLTLKGLHYILEYNT